MATGFSVRDALNRNSKSVTEPQESSARFRTKDISIFKMYRNEKNFYSVENIEELAGDILTFGLKQNLELIYDPCDKGEYRIVAGERRWEALKLLVSRGFKKFEIATCKLTIPQDEDEEQVEIIIANTYRQKTEMDMIEEEQRLKESLERLKAAGRQIKGYDLSSGRLRDVIANMLNLSKTKVAQIESVNNGLIPEFKEEMKQGHLNFSTAYELSGLTPDLQKWVFGNYTGENLSVKEIKKLKEKDTVEDIAEKIVPENVGGPQEEVPPDDNKVNVSEIDTDFSEMNPPEEEEEVEPLPGNIVSICYSCMYYSDCNSKSNTVTTCNKYINKAEKEKTDEQRYSEEQDRMDRETERRLRQQDSEEKMKTLPSESPQKRQTHQIRIASMYYDDVSSGKKTFELRKNDRHYKIGDLLELMEFKDKKNTGRIIRGEIVYMLEDYTGIEEGYCILGIKLIGGSEKCSKCICQECKNQYETCDNCEACQGSLDNCENFLV